MPVPLSGDTLNYFLSFLALDGLLVFTHTSKSCSFLVKDHLRKVNQKIHDVSLLGIKNTSKATVACKVICKLVGGPEATVRYARSLASHNLLARKIMDGPNDMFGSSSLPWWNRLHSFALMFLLCPEIKRSLTLAQTLAVWVLAVESRLLRPSQAEILSAILCAASRFPNSFPREPVSVSFVASLLGCCGNHNDALGHVGRLDTGEPRISSARVQYLNLIIQVVLGYVLPTEQRASLLCVLSRKMTPARRRRAVATAMVWTHIWLGRR